MCGYFCIGFIDFMFDGKSLTDYTNLFSLNNFKKSDDIILNYFLNKMVEINSIECNSTKSIEHNFIDTSNLNNQQFGLNKISEIEDYFITEITERKLMSKKLSTYISFFGYFDKSLIALSVISGSISIASFATVIGINVGITSASLSLAFSLCTGLVKKLLKATINKKKRHNKIVMLARSKLNSIKNKISEALINNQIIHEGFRTIINEERNYIELKESIRMMMKGQEDKKIDTD